MYRSWEYMTTPKRAIRTFIFYHSLFERGVNILFRDFCCSVKIAGMTAAPIDADFLRLDFLEFDGSYFFEGILGYFLFTYR